MKLARDEFQKLAIAQMDTLFRLARRLTRDASGAEDLVQETYARAFRAAGNFELQDFGIRPWLARILHNLHTSRAERESRQPRATDLAALEAAAGPVMDRSDKLPPIDPASFEAMDERLVAALDSLPPEYKSVLLLWAVEDFSYKEIAAALEIPIGTVMSRLYRARQQLSEQLRPNPSRGGRGAGLE